MSRQELQFEILENEPTFSLEDFGLADDLDLNSAFQEAMVHVASDEELAFEEKIRRMETIVSEGNSEIYRDFVDFRQMAAQMNMMCSHDHNLSQSMQNSDVLSNFMKSHTMDDGHGHTETRHNKHDDKDEDEGSETKSSKKKKKKRLSLLSLFSA